MRLCSTAAAAALAASLRLQGAMGHGSHDSQGDSHGHDPHGAASSISEFGNDWATWHMAEEHQLASFDAASFFTLHDFNDAGAWSPGDIRRFYGLDDASLAHVPASKREEVIQAVLAIFDQDGNGRIERREFVQLWEAGKRLPDFGLGPGHHGDDEYEYEIHHWEKYHDENTRLEDLTHPEDIEHFAKHDREEAEHERLAAQKQYPVIESNIPDMFRRKPKLRKQL